MPCVHGAIRDSRLEVFIPYTLAFRLLDLITAFDHPVRIIGLRPGERLHERLTERDSSDKPARFMTIQQLKEAIA